LVHDISDSTLNQDLIKWHKDIVEKRPARHNPVVIVVSNKTDIRPFCSDDVSDWVRENSFDHMFTSAQTGENVEKLFQKIRDAILVHQTDWLQPSLPALPMQETVHAPGCSC
jgi:50S ribosomal subunit-associated GTPase HflX